MIISSVIAENEFSWQICNFEYEVHCKQVLLLPKWLLTSLVQCVLGTIFREKNFIFSLLFPAWLGLIRDCLSVLVTRDALGWKVSAVQKDMRRHYRTVGTKLLFPKVWCVKGKLSHWPCFVLLIWVSGIPTKNSWPLLIYTPIQCVQHTHA